MQKEKAYITAIEIGTANIKAICAQINPNEVEEVLAVAEYPTDNLVCKGEIVYIQATLELLAEVFNQLEKESGIPIKNLYLAISGNHIHHQNISGSVPILSPDHTVTFNEINQAVEQARHWYLPPDKIAINSYQRFFEIDHQYRYKNPYGIPGSYLTAHLHVIYGDRIRIEPFLKLLQNFFGDIQYELVFSGIAGYYGLNPVSNQEQGLLYIDIGKGITEYVLFHEEGCITSGQIAVGCDHLANDIALAFKIPIKVARDLIVQYGSLVTWEKNCHQTIRLSEVQDPEQEIPVPVFNQIIELRMKELLEIIKIELEESQTLPYINCGIALGGGGSNIKGIDELARSTFDVPAWIGTPQLLPNLPQKFCHPGYITPIGLTIFGQKRHFSLPEQPSFTHLLRKEFNQIWSTVCNAFRL